VASAAVSMALAPDERSLYVLARQPRALIAVELDGFRSSWSLPLAPGAVRAGSLRGWQAGGHNLGAGRLAGWT